MRKRYGIGALVASLVFLGGCIITSTSPNPSQTVFMNPGEEKTFSVTSIGGPLISNGWYIDGVWAAQESIGPVGSFTYAPTSVDIGRHRLRINVIDYRIDSIGIEGLKISILWQGEREWDVVVNGVQITPFVNLVFPGESREFTATAYPEGAYDYAWYLDGAPVSTGERFTFAPTAAQEGTHTLSVKTTGAGIDYESTIKIQVPFATVGSAVDDVPGHLVQKSDGGYVATGYSQAQYNIDDIQVFALAADGSLQWRTTLGGTGIDRDGGVIATTDGGYIVAGTSSSGDIPGAARHGWNDIYLAKLDAQGTVVWQNLYGGSGDDTAVCLTPTADGGFVVAGRSNSQNIPGLSGHGNDDFYVIKFGADATVQWQNLYDAGSGDAATSIRQTTDGGYIMTGTTDKDINNTIACLLKLDPTGGLQWSKRYSSGVSTTFADVRVTPDGGFLAAGNCVKQKSTGGILTIRVADALLVKYNAKGVLLWEKTYGGESDWDSIAFLLPASGGGYAAFGTSYSNEIPGGHYDYGYVLIVDALGNAQHQERIPDVVCPIPIEEGGYMAIRKVTRPAADNTDISLVMLGAS